MTLAQVQAAVAVVAALVGTWTGLLIAVALLLPKQAARAELALEEHPKACFVSGLGMVAALVGVFIVFQIPNTLVKLIGQLLFLGISATLILGGAGLATLMGRRISEMSGAKTSFGSLVRGSLIYSMAIGFPYVGWLLFAPLSAIFALGAGIRTLWPRRHQIAPVPLTSIEGHGAV